MRHKFLALLVLFALLIAAPAVFAQGNSPTTIMGEVEAIDGDTIVVDGITINLNGVFDPDELVIGVQVIVIGDPTPGEPLQARNLMILEDDEAEDDATTSTTGNSNSRGNSSNRSNTDDDDDDNESSGSTTGNSSSRGNSGNRSNTDDDDDDNESSGSTTGNMGNSNNAACLQSEQPTATTLAESFGIPYETIMAWHCAGNGFGNIARALLIEETGVYTAEYLLMEYEGGWGAIKQDLREEGYDPNHLGQTLGNSQTGSDGSPGQSGSAPGQSSTDGSPGQSGSAPGQSGSAPGQSGNSHGNNKNG